MSSLPIVKCWLAASVMATLAGWALSVLGHLDRGGYAGVLLLLLVVLGVGRPAWSREFVVSVDWGRAVRRFRRGLPASFLLLAVLIFLGGVLYPPSNHTALTYRTPRVLHWLAEGHWHWIHTPDYRMNNRACGIEWLSAPLLLFTGSDRLLFLLNFVPFLLLPGLIFSVCRRLGIRGRVAWVWMWLLPTGYNFLLQAGSTGNDTFPTVYALAAVDFGCRAWASRRVSDVWWSILAAALLTGAKASNLPLLLPWAVLMLRCLPVLKTAVFRTGAVMVVAAVVSFLPTAALNIRYCGDWSGLNLEHVGMDMKHPLVGLGGNAFLWLFNNFLPPFFPFAGWWNRSALTVLPQFLVGPLNANFEQGWHVVGELPTEDWVGIGLGVSLLMLICGVAAWGRRRTVSSVSRRVGELSGWWRWCVLLAPWCSLAAYAMKSGMVTGARLIAPYYPLLLPLLLTGDGPTRVVRSALWRWMVGGAVLLAIPVVVLTPGRPLWPARTVLAQVVAKYPGSVSARRALTVYEVYGRRSDPLAEIRKMLPAEAQTVGFLGTEDDIDISLWRPFGHRRVEHFLLTDPPDSIRQRGIRYVVVGGYYLGSKGVRFEDWLLRAGGEEIGVATVTQKVAEGPQSWHLVRLR